MENGSDVASPGEPVPLADHCLAYAMAHFDLSTCCPTFHIADVLALPALRLAAQHFIQDNFDRVCQARPAPHDTHDTHTTRTTHARTHTQLMRVRHAGCRHRPRNS
jgi:thioesterase domain-containing protein